MNTPTPPLTILADENIPFAAEAFAWAGHVRTMAGRDMHSEHLTDVDVLLVRSVTTVDEALVGGSSVQFVGTATIGTDHIDLDYLQSAGIGFASAPGSNATSVSEYLTCALLVLERDGLVGPLDTLTLGVVGVGNVGTRVARKARALGMRVLLNDPPRARAESQGTFVGLDTLLAEADVLTLHVPWTSEGPDATHHLMCSDTLGKLAAHQWLFNTARGAVVDGSALGCALDAGTLAGAVLDVWEGEPTIDVALLQKVRLATPHIAGYALDGKVRGTTMLVDALAAHLQRSHTWVPSDHVPPPTLPQLQLDQTSTWMQRACLTAYPIEEDGARLRATALLPPDERGAAFRALRKNYPVRREFNTTRLHVPGVPEEAIAELGFSALSD